MIEHLGDITKISGRMARPVRVIIGGSPCQDLSVAGRRAGLSGERSSLFMEQIRIIKEMRETYGKEYPRYMVWERLQGYPDGWTDIGAWTDSKGKLHKESTDSARYRACGNSIALPPWRFVLGRLAEHLERGATMASLLTV